MEIDHVYPFFMGKLTINGGYHPAMVPQMWGTSPATSQVPLHMSREWWMTHRGDPAACSPGRRFGPHGGILQKMRAM